MNLVINKFNIKYLKKLKTIYNSSFPSDERFPMWLLLFNIYMKRSELYMLFDSDNLCGFIYLINYKDMCFILYLAIDESYRNKGYGSYILKWCMDYKKDKDIYLNVEDVEEYDKFDIRKKRLEFYLKNGFYITDYLSIEKCGKFNILSNNKIFKLNEYKMLDKEVSSYFLENKSKIVKRVYND